MNEKRKYIGGVNFEELRAQRVQVYNTVTLDLTTAQTDKELVFTGTYIYVLESTDILANVNIRLNEKFRGLINLTKGRGVKAPFYRLYITNAAQAGKTITLGIGIESDTFEVFDVGKALELSGLVKVDGTDGLGSYGEHAFVGATAELILAANPNRKRVHLVNIGATGLDVYLGTDNSVTTALGYPIYPVVDAPLACSIVLHHKGTIYGVVSVGAVVRWFEETYL